MLADETPHVAAPPHAGHATIGTAVMHWAEPVVPRHPNHLEDEVENVLSIVAVCQPYESALAVWESALKQGVVDVRALRRLDLGPAARRLRDEADPFADSGLESFVVPRLRWMRLPLRRQVWIAGRPVDLLIGERLILQIDGGHHVGAQRERDIAHDAELALLGYHVIRVGYGAIVDDWAAVQARLMRAVAQGLHRVM
ncbi:endonuclease domain-containing protein [Microbacterium sp. P05]|uniref:endonuclease domain-containing protein n=1 Tax=Microbacterium sp. P05 TaxID=3366948 RepID=UPI00374736C2